MILPSSFYKYSFQGKYITTIRRPSEKKGNKTISCSIELSLYLWYNRWSMISLMIGILNEYGFNFDGSHRNERRECIMKNYHKKKLLLRQRIQHPSYEWWDGMNLNWRWKRTETKGIMKIHKWFFSCMNNWHIYIRYSHLLHLLLSLCSKGRLFWYS